jgi:hypothetical protein
MKAIKIIFAMCIIVMVYANAVIPVKKKMVKHADHKTTKLKVVFGGSYKGMIDQ